MADQRWTDATQDLVADLLYRGRDGDGHVDAVRILTALADARALRRPEECPFDHGDPFGPEAGMTRMSVPLATETRVEWSTSETVDEGGGATTDEAQARDWLRRDHDWPSTQDSKLVTRCVHTEPWRAA